MILESLAQYSALMVLKEHYPIEKVNQFLALQLDDYLADRRKNKFIEVPLVLVEDEDFIYYSKGVINMYSLQQHIGEDTVNDALSKFLKKWKSFNNPKKLNRYATTHDLLDHFYEVTPDSLKQYVSDLFERVCYYDFQLLASNVEKDSLNNFKITTSIKANKYYLNDKGEEASVAFHDWIDVVIYAFDEYQKEKIIFTEKVLIDSLENQIQIITQEQPSKVSINTNHTFIDINPKNNEVVLNIPIQ